MEKTLERVYNVPLRKGFQKAPKYKRAKKAIIVLKEFLSRHMKCSIEDIKLGKRINETIWARGYKYPPHHIKIKAVKDEKGVVKAELYGYDYQEPIISETTEKETKNKEEKQEIEEKNEENKVENLDLDEEIKEKEEKEAVKKTKTKKVSKEKKENSEKKETKKVKDKETKKSKKE
ncbi:MAG: 50S ribosomal protein L31e [Candidatus Woesearchaeota archaeon]